MGQIKIKPEFGNTEQIALLELEKKYADKSMKPVEWIECDCDCPNCDAEIQRCPYCKESSLDQFTDNICIDCQKEAIPYEDYRRIKSLGNKLLTN